MAMEDTRSVKLFYSYSHKDKGLRDELANHLGRSYITWHDRDITAGTDWEREISDALNNADIILLLISSDFMVSEYCSSIEMKRALERQAKGEAWVIPVILRPVHWEDAPFSKLNVLPAGGKPVSTWLNKDEAFVDIARGVREAIKKVLKRREGIKNQYIAEAEGYTATGQYRAAYDSLRKALQNYPDDVVLYERIGDSLRSMQHLTEALRAYRKAAELGSVSVQLYTNAGQILVGFEQFQEAVSAFQSALQLAGDNIALFQYLGDAFEKLGRFKEAIESFEKAINLAGTNTAILAELYTRKGHIHFALREYKEAVEAHQKAIKLDERNAQLWRNKAEVLMEDPNCYTQAQEAYQEAIARDPRNAFLYKEYGDALVVMDNLPEALAAYNDAIQIDENFGFAYLSRSKLREKMAEQTRRTYDDYLRSARDDRERAKTLGALEEDT